MSLCHSRDEVKAVNCKVLVLALATSPLCFSLAAAVTELVANDAQTARKQRLTEWTKLGT